MIANDEIRSGEPLESFTSEKPEACPPFVRVPETTSPKNCRYRQRSGLGFVGL
jgi:hypothetical protein